MRAQRPKWIIYEETKGTSLSISRLLNGLMHRCVLARVSFISGLALAKWRLPEKSVNSLSPFDAINNKKSLFILSKSIS